jgi:hypothetical protein
MRLSNDALLHWCTDALVHLCTVALVHQIDCLLGGVWGHTFSKTIAMVITQSLLKVNTSLLRHQNDESEPCDT